MARFPVWGLALSTTLGMQVSASMLDQTLAVVAPLLTAELGIAPEKVGHLSSLSALGTVLFLAFGTPVLARFGPVRTLQCGAMATVAGLLLATTAVWPLMLCAALLMGLGYGPTPPAGSRILVATAPARHRTLIFSLKQAGAPAGGALAALLIAPVAARYGWQAAIGLALAIGLLAAFAIEPARPRLDVERRPDQPISFAALASPRAVLAPFRALAANAPLLAIASLAFSFAVAQGVLFSFTVTYLVVDRGVSLPDAAFAYACMQGAGVVARIGLGWLADRTGRPALNLVVQGFAAAALMAAYGQLPTGPPVGLCAALAAALGFCGASWNGIFLAEVARLTPLDRVAEATSASVLVAFVGYAAGPTLAAILVAWTGSYGFAFSVVAAQLAFVAGLQVWLMARRFFRKSGCAT